jgi:hypothetical protein
MYTRGGVIMRAASLTTLAALLSGVLFWQVTASAQNEPRQDRNVGQQTVHIILHSATVKPLRADAKPWRSGDRKTDIVVKIKNASQPGQREFASPELKNVFSGKWENVSTVTANVGDELRIQVVDHGAIKDAMIGEATFKLSANMVRQGKVDFQFGQVESLVLEFRK